MKIPNKIKVCHYNYNIIETNDDEFLDSNWGLIDYGQEVIYIRKDLTHSNKQTILLHELLHACFHMNRNNLVSTPNKKSDIKEWEHHFIYGIEELLMDVIKSNPKIMKYLQSEGK